MQFNSISGFDWEAGNRDKNLYLHQVSWIECEEGFFNLPLVMELDITHSSVEERFTLLGQTNAGRHLFLVFTIRNEKIRVISARDMSKKERAEYEKDNT